MRAAEEAAFASGIEADALMDRAGTGVAAAVQKFFPRPGRAIIFCGKGHNGGDALVAGTRLREAGWHVELRVLFPEEDLAELTRKKLTECRTGAGPEGPTGSHLIVLDGLLGLGATHLLREPVRSAAQEINRLRQEQNAFVFAVDLPTGLDGDNADADPDCVMADCTITIGNAKHGMVVDSATDYVGRIEIVALSELTIVPSAANDLVAT